MADYKRLTKETRVDINQSKFGASLSWKNLSFSVPLKDGTMKDILNSVSGGPSGAGKTTLIKMLAGRVDPKPVLSGQVLMNGRERTPAFIHQSAFVTQDDHLLPNLTVRETLQFTARLRLPRSVSDADREAAVDKVINELGLVDCQHTYVGGTPLVTGVSGGERRRVSIGVEMITNPMIMFLDEPTSGLDSTTAFKVAQQCKRLAQLNRVVLMSIHQPKASIFKMFDKVILMAQGHIAYFGTPDHAISFFSKIGHALPEQTNPADFYMDCLTLDLVSETSAKQSQAKVDKLVTAWKTEMSASADSGSSQAGTQAEASPDLGYANGWLREVVVLFHRNWINILREKTVTLFAVLQAVFFGLLIGAVYFDLGLSQVSIQNRNGVLFFICLNQAFGPMFQVINVFLREKSIFHNEYFSGSYRVLTYFLAKNISEIPLQIAPPVIFASIVYWMVGLQDSLDKFLIYLLLVVFTAMVSQSIGLCVAAAVSKLEVATAITPVIIILFMLFAGFYVNVGTLSVAFEWIKWISYIQWSFRGFCQNEFKGLVFQCSPDDNGCYENGDQVLAYLDFDEFDPWICIFVMLGMIGFFRTLAYFFLAYKDLPKLRFL